MKRFQVLLVIGGIGLLIGSNILVLGLIPNDSGRVTDSLNIPAEDYYYYFEFNVGQGMTLEGEFRELQGSTVRVMLLSASQYSTYEQYGTSSSPLLQRSGSSGTFSFSPESGGKYYLVFEHLSTTSAQNLTLTWRLSGTDYTTALAGAVIVAVGAGFMAWGSSEKKREARMTPPWAPAPYGQDPAAGVVFFPPPPPPSNAQILPAAPGGGNGPKDPQAGTEGRPDPERRP